MTKRMLTYCAVVLFSAGALSTACDDTIAASNCGVKCQEADNTCVQTCTDDACKTVCHTDLDNCKASCSSVTSTPPDGGR